MRIGRPTVLTRPALTIILGLAPVVASNARAQPAERRPSRPERPGRAAGARDYFAEQERAAAQFKPNQPVEAMFHNQWTPATVVEVRGRIVRVRINENGIMMGATPDRVRALAAGANKGAAAPPVAGAPAAGGPSVPAAAPQAERPGAAGAQAAAGAPPTVPADWSGARAIKPGGGAWSYKPAAPAGKAAAEPKAVTLPPAFPPDKNTPHPGATRSFWEKYGGATVPDPSRPVVYLRYTDEPPGGPKRTRVQQVDVAAGKVAATYDLPGEIVLVDVSPDGKRVLLRSNGLGLGTRGRIDVFDISDAQPKHVVSFEPYKGETNNNNDVGLARFVDNDHLLTSNGQGRAALWQVPAAKAVWVIDAGSSGGYTLRPDRAVIALAAESALHLLDARSGASLGQVAAEERVSSPRFNKDGTRLAASAGTNRLQIWDLQTPKLIHDVPLQRDVTTGALRWLDDGLLLLGNRDVLDPGKGVVVWQYLQPGGSGSLLQVAGRFGLLSESSAGRGGDAHRTLSFFALPHPPVRERATALPANDVLVVRPGAKISLDFDFDGPADMREKAEQNVRDQLRQNGVTVAEGQLVRLLVSSKPGKTKEIGYGSGSRLRGPEETLSVTEQIHRVAFLSGGGTVLWESTWSFDGEGLFVRKQGQSMAQVVGERKVSSYRYFASIKLPKFIPKPLSLIPPGRSNLTPQGPKGDVVPPLPVPAPVAAPPAPAPARKPAPTTDVPF